MLAPLDTVKTRLQFQAAEHRMTLRRYPSFTGAFAAIWRSEGVRGLFSGVDARLLYSAPSAAVTFFFYERAASSFLDKREGRLGETLKYASQLGFARVVGTLARGPFE